MANLFRCMPIEKSSGVFVCVGASGKSYYSTDGASWIAMTGLSSTTFNAVTYGNGRFVCVGDSGKSYYSIDGNIWNAMTGLSTSSSYRGVTYGDGRFVCVGTNGKSYYSTNGTSWTAMTGLASAYYYGVAYGDGMFVCVGGTGSSGKSYYSTNGTSWTTMSGVDGTAFYGVTYGNGRFMCAGENNYTDLFGYTSSSDNKKWVVDALPTWTGPNAITYGKGRTVIVFYSGKSYYYDIGSDWVAMNILHNSEKINCVTYGNGKFIYVTQKGNVAVTKGNDWVETFNLGSEIKGICYSVDGGYNNS